MTMSPLTAHVRTPPGPRRRRRTCLGPRPRPHALSGGALHPRPERSARRRMAQRQGGSPPAGSDEQRQADPCCASTSRPDMASAARRSRATASWRTSTASCSGSSARWPHSP